MFKTADGKYTVTFHEPTEGLTYSSNWHVAGPNGLDQKGKGLKSLLDTVREHQKQHSETQQQTKVGGIKPPDNYSHTGRVGGFEHFQHADGNYVMINDEGRWQFYDAGSRLSYRGDTQEGLQRALDKAQQAEEERQQARESTQTHGKAPFAETDLKPLKGFELRYDGETSKVYRHENGDTLQIYQDGRWKFFPHEDDSRTVQGTTQADLDKAVSERRGTKPPVVSKISNTQVSAKVSKQFADQTVNGLNALPQKLHDTLNKANTRVVIAHTVTEARPDLKGQKPRGWAAGSTWDMVDGLYNESRNEIVVSEHYQHYTQKNTMVRSYRGPGVMAHEVGHAFDAALGRVSRTQAFIDAYRRDIREQNLGMRKTPSLAYYLQKKGGNDEAGRSECFAEVCAQVAESNGSHGASILHNFPRVAEHIRGLLA